MSSNEKLGNDMSIPTPCLSERTTSVDIHIDCIRLIDVPQMIDILFDVFYGDFNVTYTVCPNHCEYCAGYINPNKCVNLPQRASCQKANNEPVQPYKFDGWTIAEQDELRRRTAQASKDYGFRE